LQKSVQTLFESGSLRVFVSKSTKKEGCELMPLIQVVVVLVVVGVILWLINRFIPMARSIKSILNAVVIIAVVLWLLNVFGISSYLSTIRVGR
jgi:uncharacterized BrkB/YihY/UPF0761 family membrane protein